MPPARRRVIALPALSLVFALFVCLLLPASARADAPAQMPAQVVDAADVLTAAQENEIMRAVDDLTARENLQLWVIYVRDFDGLTPEEWGRQTQELSELSYRDILLAVSVTDRSYYFGSAEHIDDLPQNRLNEIARSTVEPAVRDGEWTDAALDASNRIAGVESRRALYAILGAVVVIAILGGLIILFARRSSNAAGPGEGPADGDPLTVDQLTRLPVTALDPWATERLTSTDDAVSVSADELILAEEEFGPDRVAAFRAALTTAESAVATAFALRHEVDRGGLGPEEQRDRLVRIISICSDADRALDEQTSAFDALRDLVPGAAGRLDRLSERSAALAARLAESAGQETYLAENFGGPIVESVDGNLVLAGELIQFADDSIEQGRDAVADQAEQRQSTVAAIRSAESALDTAAKLLDALTDAAQNLVLLAQVPNALAQATAEVAAAESFIDTRRGAVGTRARTCLFEAERLLHESHPDRGGRGAGAADRATELADEALSLGRQDVAAWQESSGDDGAPVLTGVLVDAVVSTAADVPLELGNGGYSSGGRTPGSFGGSDTSGRIGTGGRR